MKLKPKPIIRKSIKEIKAINEKASCVPTFPHLKRKPSAYKLLDTKPTQDEFKIQDIETITNLIKQLDRKELDPVDNISKPTYYKKNTHFERKKNRFITNPALIKQQIADVNTKESINANGSTTLIEESPRKDRIGKTYLPKVVTLPSSLNVLSSFDVSSKDVYYSSLYTENNYGKKVKTFSLPITEKEEQYYKKIKNLIFDNKILNHKEFQPLLQFSQMKQEHFKLFERMKYLKGTKSRSKKNKTTMKKLLSITTKKEYKYVALEKAFLVPLDKIDEFKLLLINNYISQIDFSSTDDKIRKIFVIIDGTVIINSSYIPGVCIEMPRKSYLLKLSPEMRSKYYDNFLKICRGRCNSKCWFKNIVSSHLKLIVDLAEINDNDKFIFISASNSYQGISIPLSNNIMKTYTDNYSKWKKKETEENNSSDDEYKVNYNIDDVYEIYFNELNTIPWDHFKKMSEIKKMYQYDTKTTSISTLKQNTSFSNAIEIMNDDYFYYSDNEKRVIKTKEFIKRTLPTKGAFFIYIQNNIYDTKLANIKKNFTENKAKTIEKNISEMPSEDVIAKYISSNQLMKHFIVPKDKGVLTTQELTDGINLLSQDQPKLKLGKIFNQSKSKREKYPIIQRNIDLNSNPYLDIDKRTQTEYTHLVSYNIPKILSLNNHFNRRQLFTFFTQFKSLVALWLTFHKRIPIAVYGIDFDLFKQCIPELRNEEEKLLKKIFKQMNLSSSTLLSLDEFIEGMSVINRQKTKDKIDFFLEVFDKRHSGIFTYDEVKKISQVAIRRLLVDKLSQNSCINDLRDYLTDFIFGIVNCDKEKGLSIEKMKEMMSNSKEKDLEYLEIFCCAKKANYMYAHY